MSFIERFTDSDEETIKATLREQVDTLELRLSKVSSEELTPKDWEDEELVGEQGIELKPKWKQVELPILGEPKLLNVAAVVSPCLHEETGEEIGRSLTIIGQLGKGNESVYAVIGSMNPGRYEGDTPSLMLNNGSDSDAINPVPWESADAAVFMKLADQLLPSIS